MSDGTVKVSMPAGGAPKPHSLSGRMKAIPSPVAHMAAPHRSKVPAWHHVAEVMIRVLALTAIAAIILIFAFVAKEALPLFYSDVIQHEVTLRQMWFSQTWPGYDSAEYIWQPVSNVPKYAIWPLILGTLKVSLVSMLVATPLGVASALYLSQYASRRVRELVKPAIELLAGIPSVVLGFFALMVMASWFQDAFDLDSRLNSIVAGVALSFAIIPLIFTISEEAFGAVPRSYIEASTALGAARWQTIVRVLIPAASPGIAAAMALGLGRAVGETMVVLMASGNAAITSGSFTESVRTLSASIAAELAEVVFGGPHYTVLFYLGTFLFVITFGINLMGDLAIRRMKRKLGVGA